MEDDRLKIGIYGLTGCAGDQLAILDCEDRIIELFRATDIRSFFMAKSDNHQGKLDVAFVEGSVSTQKDKEDLLDIRERSDLLVAIGLCACTGGVQAAFLDRNLWVENYRKVYGGTEMSHTGPSQSKPLDAFVNVDFRLPGCPISEQQFLPALTRVLARTPPDIYSFPVCMECKWNEKENECLLNKGTTCLGPITAAGCGAVCPSLDLACAGCWGPSQEPNYEQMFQVLLEKGFDASLISRKMRSFSGVKIAEFVQKLEENGK